MFKKIIAVFCCAVLLICGTSCGQDTEPIVTIDGVEFSVGQFLMYQLTAYNTIADRMEYTFNKPDEDGNVPTVKRQMAFTNVIDGTRVDVWITATTLEELRMAVYFDRMLEEYGIEITAQDIEDSDKNGENLYNFYEENNERYYSRNGIGAESVKFWLLNTLKEQRVFLHLYGKGGAKEVPEDELREYFLEQYAYTKMLSIPYYDLSTGTQYSTEQVNDIENYCKGVVERINAGESIDTINTEISLGSGQIEEGATMAPIQAEFFDFSSKEFTGNLVNAYRELGYNQAGYDKDPNTGFFYIFVKLDPMAEGLTFYEDNRTSTLLMLKNDEFTADVMEITDGYEIDKNVPLMKKYLPENISKLTDYE